MLRYITALHSYVLSFTKKTQPLVDIAAQQKDANSEFEDLWNEKKLPGWTDNVQNQSGDVKAEGEGIWCGACRSLNFLPREQGHSFFLKTKNSTQNKPFTMRI